MTKFIVVASSKGGVGKTTTALNLATALMTFGREVIVVDVNLSTPNVSLYLGAPNVPITLHDVLKHDKKITDALYMHTNGLKIIPASQSIRDIGDVDYDRLASLIKNLSGTVDYVIIDTAAGLGEEAISGIKMGDEILVVSTPDMPSVTDALRTIKIAKQHKKKITGVIMTRAYEDELELKKEDVETILETQVIGIIPEDETMRDALQMRSPVTFTHPNAPSSLGYKKLAAKLLGEKYIESVEKKDNTMDTLLKRLGMR